MFNPTEDWTTMDNADFIQSGLISIKQSEESPDYTSLSSYISTEQASPPVTDYQILESCDPLSLYQDLNTSQSYQPQVVRRHKTSSQLANILQGGQYERPPPPPPPPHTLLQAPQTDLNSSYLIENTIVKKKSVIVSLDSVTSDLVCLDTTEPSTSSLTPGATRPPPRKKIKLDKRSNSSNNRKSSEKHPVGESTNVSFAKLNLLVPSLSESSLKILNRQLA